MATFDRDNLFMTGYMREIDEIFRINIPQEILGMIQMFMAKLKIYGIGKNADGVFGLKHKAEIRKFTRLQDLEELVPNFVNIYCNMRSLIVVTSNNSLFVAGDNSDFRLGIKYSMSDSDWAEKTEISQFTLSFNNIKHEIKLFSKGAENTHHTFIYTQNGILYANGSNYHGRCGINNNNNKQLKDDHDAFVLEQVNTKFIGNNDNIIDIHCGYNHSVFLTKNGLVYCCGINTKGQCGVVDNDGDDQIINPIQFGYDRNEEDVLYPVPIDQTQIGIHTKIIAISCGYSHNLAIDNKQRLIVWGNNQWGRLGFDENITQIVIPIFQKCFIHNKVNKIRCGYSHSLVITDNGQCYTFGNNGCGQNGNGNLNHNYVPFNVPIDNGYCIDGDCGETHTVLLTQRNNIITFGNNESNQCSIDTDVHLFKNPHILSKVKEIGISNNAFVEKVFCLNFETIIIVNPYKTVK